MTELSEIFDVPPESWFDVLKPYQRNIVDTLYNETQNYEEVAKYWLTANSLPNNAPFGAKENRPILYEKVLDEIEAFFSGDEKYENARHSLLKESGAVQTYVAMIISDALGSVLGVSGTFLAPVIVIILCCIGRIGLNAWLTARKEKKEQENKTKLPKGGTP